MAWVEKRSGGWLGRYRVNGRTYSTPLFKSKTRARSEANRAEQEGKAGGHIPRSASNITLSAWFDEWSAGRKGRAPRTRETEGERFRTLIAPTFGNLRLSAIRYGDVVKWSDSMRGANGEVASQARRRDAVRLLTQILDAAVDAHRLQANPARTASGKTPYMPRQSRSKAHRYLSNEELQRVADAAKTEQAKTLILLAGLTGLRWGELSALTVGDIDFLRGRIAVTKAYTRLDSGELLLGDTKTHASREVTLPRPVRERLALQIEGRGRDELVFATQKGGPLRREAFDRNTFKPAVQIAGQAITHLQELLGFAPEQQSGIFDSATADSLRALQQQHGLEVSGLVGFAEWRVLTEKDRRHRKGLSQGEKVRRTNLLKVLSQLTLRPGASDFDPITLHDLRHTAASLAISAGASVKVVQRLLGHESAMLTLNTYAGLFESDLDALGEAMDSAHAAHHVPTGAPNSVARIPLPSNGYAS